MPKTNFRAAAAERLAEERELPPAILNLLAPNGGRRPTGVRVIPLDSIDANPNQPRMTYDEDGLRDLAASVQEHGVLQPILVRPGAAGRYELIAGERRWRASSLAGLTEIAAIVEEIDDDTALEIAIIENLQREDLSPLDEALMFERMTHEHGYSVRKLAQKVGKDKGYIENRLRLADAPAEVKQLVSLRKDTLSHAYELLKVEDPKKRRKLAEQVARGELSLVKLRERIDGRPPRDDDGEQDADRPTRRRPAEAAAPEPVEPDDAPLPNDERALLTAKGHLSQALDELSTVFRAPEVLTEIDAVDRANLAKYLTIAKLRLENVIALVRVPDSRHRP